MSFCEIIGASALLRNKGRWKSVSLYSNNGILFARDGQSFIRINSNGTTSVDCIFIENMVIDADLFEDKFGRLAILVGEGRKALPGNKSTLLLSPPE